MDPSIFYEDGPIATRIDEGALIVDGERLATTLPFKAIIYSEQADRLADIQIRTSRYQANAEICLRPKYPLQLKPGRWVTWESQKYGTRTFLVISKRLGAIGDISVRPSHAAGDRRRRLRPDGIRDRADGDVAARHSDYASELDNFLAQPYILMRRKPPAKCPLSRTSWDAVEDTTITGIQFEYWPVAQPTNVVQDNVSADFTVKHLTVGVISSTAYEGRYRLVSDPPRAIPWVSWGPVTTPAASETDVTVKLGNLSPGVRAELQRLPAIQALLTAKMQQLAAAVTEEARQATDARVVAVRDGNAQAVAMSELSAGSGDLLWRDRCSSVGNDIAASDCRRHRRRRSLAHDG